MFELTCTVIIEKKMVLIITKKILKYVLEIITSLHNY